MRGVAGRHKQYVDVIVRMQRDGSCVPLSVIWEDGTRYPIREVLDVRPASARLTEGAGMRYTVRVGTSDTYLFREGDRWFVEAKDVPL